MMLRGKKFDVPALFEGSIHNDREELRELLSGMEGILSGHSFDAATVRTALELMGEVIGESIDRDTPIAVSIRSTCS